MNNPHLDQFLAAHPYAGLKVCDIPIEELNVEQLRHAVAMVLEFSRTEREVDRQHRDFMEKVRLARPRWSEAPQ